MESGTTHRLTSYLTPKAEVRESPVEGRGIFARDPIAVHELVAFWTGSLRTFDELNALPESVSRYSAQVWFDTFIGAGHLDDLEPVDFMNHSCDPNCGVRGSVTIVARRAIAAGEELTYDYSTSDTLGLEMSCSCGAVACRGNISGDTWRDPTFCARNAGYLSLYIEELIAAERGQPIVGLPNGELPAAFRRESQTSDASSALDAPCAVPDSRTPHF